MGQEPTAPFTSGPGGLTQQAGLSTGPVPLDPYRTQEFFEKERDRIYRRAWLIACRVEELANPGDYVLKQIDPCNVSALITKANNGHIQAFYNTCSHRGSAVVSNVAGNQARFVCPYHNWTYANDGRLVGMPDAENFFNIDKPKCGLKPIATDIWDGWVFINLQPEPEVSLSEFLGEFKDHFGGMKYQAVSASPVIFHAELDANWKVVLDAFAESYHIPFIHPQTIGTTFAAKLNPFARLLSAKLMGPHVSVSMFGNPDFQPNPNNHVEALAFRAATTGNVISAASLDDAKEYLEHPAVNPTRAQHWSMDVNQIFPHTHIDCGPGGFWTHQFWPLTPNTCRYEGRFYMNSATDMRDRLRQELYVCRVIEVLLEDLFNVSRTQHGIDTGGQSHMQLQDSEIAIRHSVNQVIRWADAATVKEALA